MISFIEGKISLTDLGLNFYIYMLKKLLTELSINYYSKRLWSSPPFGVPPPQKNFCSFPRSPLELPP